jgi:hypothetical protein
VHELACLLVTYILMFLTTFPDMKQTASFVMLLLITIYMALTMGLHILTTLVNTVKVCTKRYILYNRMVDRQLAETRTQHEQTIQSRYIEGVTSNIL